MTFRLIALLLVILSYSIHLAFVVALFYAVALVILVLTTGKAYHQLGEPLLVYEQACGHNGETGVLHRLFQFAQFASFEEQFPVAARRVVVVRAIEILGHIHIFHPHLLAYEHAIGIDKACLAEPDGFYLGTGEDYTGRIGIGDDIVKRGTFILYIYRNLSFIHNQLNAIESIPINRQTTTGTTISRIDTTIVYTKRRSSLTLMSTTAPSHTTFNV